MGMENWFLFDCFALGLSIAWGFYRAVYERSKTWAIIIAIWLGLLAMDKSYGHKENSLMWGYLQGIYGENPPTQKEPR